MRPLHTLSADNFLSLARVRVELHELSVLVGPNGAGKTNLLKVIQFLGDTVRTDLQPAIEQHGGFERLLFRGASPRPASSISIAVEAAVTRYASDKAPDEYRLTFWSRRIAPSRVIIQRPEAFMFKRFAGRGRRITVRGARAHVADEAGGSPLSVPLATTSTGLSTLPRLGKEEGREQVEQLAQLFSTFRVYEIDVDAARQPSRVPVSQRLDPDAANLAAFLSYLARQHEETFDLLQDDLRYMVPGTKALHLVPVGGSAEAISIQIEESALRGRTSLAQASFGTIRALGLLAMLHDPDPPLLTCVEEVDHGLHPYALDRLVERLRSAKHRTQLLVATHSPALVNRLDPHELVVCERDAKTGASRIPAIDPETIRKMASEEDLRLGELWFSGALGGVL